MTLSQLNRQLEYRQDKRPMLADLRESGCLTADTEITLADGTTRDDRRAVRAGRTRDVDVLTLDEHLQLVPGVMTHVFCSGVKAGVRAASSRPGARSPRARTIRS